MGLSDVAATDRTVDNINSELNAALDTMGIKAVCIAGYIRFLEYMDSTLYRIIPKK